MVGITEIGAALGGIKSALDIAKGLNAAAGAVAINDAKIALQTTILDAHGSLLAAQEAQAADARRMADLEKEIVRLEDWSAEKQRYELQSIGDRAVGYVEKETVENRRSPHWLYQHCFDDGHRSALQFSAVGQPGGSLGQMALWECGRCHSKVWTGAHATPSEPDD